MIRSYIITIVINSVIAFSGFSVLTLKLLPAFITECLVFIFDAYSISIRFVVNLLLHIICFVIRFSRFMVENRRLELLTPCVQGRCSPN